MADWQFPKDDLTDAYSNLVSYIKARDVDAGTMAAPSGSIPTGYIQYDTVNHKFKRYNGATWDDIVIAQAGGGTGATSLGTMASQNANNVAITGGSITALGTMSLSTSLLFGTDDTYNVGAVAAQVKYGFFKSGLKIPVGVDKWIPV